MIKSARNKALSDTLFQCTKDKVNADYIRDCIEAIKELLTDEEKGRENAIIQEMIADAGAA